MFRVAKFQGLNRTGTRSWQPHTKATFDTLKSCLCKIAAEKIRGSPAARQQRDTVRRLLRTTHLASDLRKHVVGVAADQFDRANHDYQDYREHHRVLGDVLTTVLGPKLTDGFNHLYAPNRRHAQASFLGTVVRRRVIVKYPEPPLHPIAHQ